MIENILRGRNLWIFQGAALPWGIIGGLAIGCNILAGHIELSIYTLLIAGYYAAVRLIWEFGRRWRAGGSLPLPWALSSSLWLLVMLLLGLGLAALQLIPLYEFVQGNWRAERSSLATVLSYAHAPRDLLQFLLPNFYGNPAHHSYTDAFSGALITDLQNARGQSISHIDWGVKNYVEGALYLGILPLALALYAVLSGLRRCRHAPHVIAFALLALISLTFMFGAPTYGLLYSLPGINQLNTPFRWVYGLTLAVAVLAGIGMHRLSQRERASPSPVAQLLGVLLLLAGLALAGGIALVHSNFAQFAPIFDRLVAGLAHADRAFADGSMLYSYQLPHVAVLALLLILSGGLFLWAARARTGRWTMLALVVTLLDLLAASYGFNPASDPALLDFTPPAVEFLAGQGGHFRVTSLERQGDPAILQPNTLMQYGLDDIRGYDSIIPAGYVATMRALQPQPRLDFNQIAPLHTAPELNHSSYQSTLASDLLNLLNLRFVLTAPDFEMRLPGWKDVYRQEVAIWENSNALPRAFAVDKADWDPRWLAEVGGGFNFAELDMSGGGLRVPRYQVADITRDSGREKFIDISLESASWLVISETYAPGWRAFARPWGRGEDQEFGVAVRLVLANFQGVELPAGDWTVRLVYSPASVQLGMFASSISVALIVFLLG
ncbi:MAG: hypothetical protein J4G18_14900, partial [Anaerolineae bacterium]|nr:hypothetical protein [Anaerolineae bacterium]